MASIFSLVNSSLAFVALSLVCVLCIDISVRAHELATAASNICARTVALKNTTCTHKSSNMRFLSASSVVHARIRV